MVELTVADGIAWLQFGRPAALNALDGRSVEQLIDHLTLLRRRTDVRVVVTHGAGRAYCAGSDLAELAARPAAAAAALEREHARAADLLAALPQPTIAMLHGYALGGGLLFALCHDLRVAAHSAILGLPEVELGWTPPWGLARLVDTVGEPMARWLVLSGARLTGREAKAAGLVHEATAAARLRGRVETLAQHLASLSPVAVRQTRAVLDGLAPRRGADGNEAASRAFEACYATPEARASVAAFLARRASKGQQRGEREEREE
jgi:enoyl-CoA hydratase/carnithine racemase